MWPGGHGECLNGRIRRERGSKLRSSAGMGDLWLMERGTTTHMAQSVYSWWTNFSITGGRLSCQKGCWLMMAAAAAVATILKQHIHFLACTVIPRLFWLRMMGTPSKHGNHLNMRRYQLIRMLAWSGVGGRSGHRSLLSKNVNCYPLLFHDIECFIMMSFVSTTLTKFPFLEGAMEPFCLQKIQSSRLRPLLYLVAKERCPSSGY